MGDQRPRRAFPKTQHPDWKEKLRQKCMQRIQEERGRLLRKMRSNGAVASNRKDAIKCVFRDIVSDELRRVWKTSTDDTKYLSTSEANDSIWEYDGPHLASGSAEGEGEREVLSEEIMIEMDRIFHEQLKFETIQRELDEFERAQMEQDEHLAQAVFEQMQLKDGQVQAKDHSSCSMIPIFSLADENGKFWCPICKKGEVQESQHFIHCTCCNLLFDNLRDQVNLNVFRLRLADAHMEHLDRGCQATPKFSMETKFGITALYINCDVCNTFEIVL